MISNATPLICLSKMNQLNLLKELFKKITITTTVRDEVLVKDKEGYTLIEQAILGGWIKIQDPKNEINFEIDKGENTSINLARELKDKLILDDSRGIRIAKSLNITYMRTISIILLALQKKLLNKKQTSIKKTS
jgi:predicted nucleic acid-binding protein|tara:strand:- start:564 stop:965 length:402 start_codon:yes stop_codon:yes gene_type:complete